MRPYESPSKQSLIFLISYDDNDASKGQAPPTAAPAEPSKPDTSEPSGAPQYEPSAHEAMNHDQDEEEEDDDDVDFNLGGGSTGMGNTNMVNAPPPEEAPLSPQYGAVHKASAKEDG